MTKKRKGKKYCPRAIKPSPLIVEAALGDVQEGELRTLHECATRAVDLLQLGTEDPAAYADVEVTVRNLWCYAQKYEETDELRMLAYMGKAAMLFLYYHATGYKDNPTWTTSKHVELDALDRQVCCRPIQVCVDTYFDMARHAERRAELVACQYAAKKQRLPFAADVCLIDAEGVEERADELMHRRGVAFVNDRCAAGFFKRDALGRIVWRMPATDAQVQITGPVFVYLIERDKINNPEDL